MNQVLLYAETEFLCRKATRSYFRAGYNGKPSAQKRNEFRSCLRIGGSLIAVSLPSGRSASIMIESNRMNIVLNRVRINAPIVAVFDLVTTACHWPQWHPSTIEVGGVIARPYQLGDKVRQVAHIGGRTRNGTWLVIEHLRPARVTLQMHGGAIEIRYSFLEIVGGTQVVRRLAYAADFVDGGQDLTAFERLMHTESALGLQQLKMLVEGIIRQEMEER